ncbi:hypothetical protein F5Y17DRAFT_10978 [Xylariaceae sp. FL0594]|nr:hypothetical protein F5Y17DRAFT_10978 [Xylariaceae sp. FL0594]
MPPDATRSNSRSVGSSAGPGSHHYTMKTAKRQPLGSPHSHHAQSPRCHLQQNLPSFRPNVTSTPISPRVTHSVGQSYTPSVKGSPGLPSEARSPSPNYFGLSLERHGDLGDSADAPLHNNWSPHSSVKSFGAAIPKQIPLDANPEFEAFRRQIDANKSNAFSLSGAYFAPPSSSVRPRPPRRSTNQSDAVSDVAMAKTANMNTKLRDVMGARPEGDSDSLHDSAYVSSDEKRNSQVSLPAASFSNMPRFESPITSDSPFEPIRKGALSKVDDRHSRLSMPMNTGGDENETGKPRAATLPSTLEEAAPCLLEPGELKNILQNTADGEYLLLDVRVATLYVQSRIRGALNLCIPTTLLKRATFNLGKLEKTLQTEEDQAKFSSWPDVKYLIIYDNSSTEKRDATAAMNMFKKFKNEGFSGHPCLVKGGYQAVAASYPDLLDAQSVAERGGTSAAASNGGRPSFAPVIGGVALPAATNPTNPFFSNIRQNMDLADGVGQMDISVPPSLDSHVLPPWLREVTQQADHGKKVSDRFLQIERNEQTRMRDAYSSFNTHNPSGSRSEKVQLSGVEQGSKNRYKDILPFEHARVRLKGNESGDCDYINASFIQASRSHKRYIAAQGPLPATFDDFWSVVWDQDVRVIVMLTAEEEGGQLKCHPYWRGRDFGPIKLRPLSERKVSLDIDKYKSDASSTSSAGPNSEAGRPRANTATTLDTSGPSPQQAQSQSDAHYVIIRKFAISHSAHPFEPIREITHLHYPSWPDFGTPAQPSHLLALVELANLMQRPGVSIDSRKVNASMNAEHPTTMSWLDEPESDAKPRPMLVHCSAGCGRTGTFCTVDSVIDILKRQRLASITKRMRKDTDGDVLMDGGGSSPKKARHDDFPKNHPPSLRGVDAGWDGETELDLIEATVEDFRKQRLSMVQSLRQFVLCYESITEWVWRLQENNNGCDTTRAKVRRGSLQGHR